LIWLKATTKICLLNQKPLNKAAKRGFLLYKATPYGNY
jgi:hypothetical protein